MCEGLKIVVVVTVLALAVGSSGCGGSSSKLNPRNMLDVLTTPREKGDELPRGGRGVGPEVMLDMRTTRRIHTPWLRNSIWIGTAPRGVCLMSNPPGAQGLGTVCFPVETIRDGAAIAIAQQPNGWFDVYGVVPNRFQKAVVLNRTQRKMRGVPVIDNVWAASVKTRPISVSIEDQSSSHELSVPLIK